MRVLADMILELMRLPEVDVGRGQAPAANAQPVAAPVATTPPAPVATSPPAMPPQLPPQLWMAAPPAEWAIPIALIAIGKAEQNPLWLTFGATVGWLSGFWSHEPKLAADPQFSVAAKRMLGAPRGVEMAMALLHDPALRAASQAMMMRWQVVTGGNVSSDGLRNVVAVDAELAAAVGAVLQTTCVVAMTFVTSNPAAATKAMRESPPKPSPEPSTPQRVNIRPPALRFVPLRAALARSRRDVHLACNRRRSVPVAQAPHQTPDIDPFTGLRPQPRSRSPPHSPVACRRRFNARLPRGGLVIG